ncbi:MAG: NlpC/P60 family protein [Desulfobacterales bacterium]
MRPAAERRRKRYGSRVCIFCLFFVLIASACAPHRQLTADNPGSAPSPPLVMPDTPRLPKSGPNFSSGNREIEALIRAEYRRWEGTTHLLGGNDHGGIDCSGFVKAVYQDLFRIDLPRTTKEQVRLGVPIIFQDMRAGDLVFFRPPDYPRHVGIYLSEGHFVHASKSQGVIISPIDPIYWKRHFWTARRILTDSE